jgi:hypothetical protein
MNDGFKVVMFVALSGLVVGNTVMPSECGRGQICAVEAKEPPHTHEREPRQTQTVQLITAVTTASSSAGTYFSVMPK